ncbi:MAG: glycoside hydrolase [Actinobacteria bacterium]|nr:glycoside hydrolase [Actinomycetota bacterium]
MRGKASLRAAAIALGTTLVLVAGPGAAGGAPVPGRVVDNTRLDTGNDPLRGRDIPAMAVDPGDARHIVMVDEDFLAGQCDFHASFDAGKTWAGGHLTAPSGFANPPCRTFDSGGYAHFNKSVVFGSGQNVYTTFASHRGDQQRPESNVVGGEGDSVIVSHSTDGGRTFQTGVVAIQGAPDSRPFVIRPGVAVQPRSGGDRVYAVGWYVNNPAGQGASGGTGDRRTVVVRSDDGGATWSTPVEAQAPGEAVREIAPPVVGPDGAVYVAWRNRDDPANAPHPIVVAKSTDGGATWARTPIGNVGPAPLSAPSPAGSSGYPRMAVDDKSGALYVVYSGFNFGDLDVILQRSNDGGATWSAPVRVNDDPRGNGVRQLTPQVFVAPNGRVDVEWMDTRATYPSPIVPKPAGSGDVYYASSTDGGATFSANRRISDRSMNLDDGLLGRIGTYTWYGPAEAAGNDSALFAWGDPRFGNVDNDTNDIVLATLQLGSSQPPTITRLPRANPANLSVAASLAAYPGGSERIGATFTTKLVVVNRKDTAGALAAAVLARANDSPLLVTNGRSLTSDEKKEIARLHPTGVFVVGGTSSISNSLVAAITKAGVNTTPPPTTAATTTVPPTTIAAPTTVAASPSSLPSTTVAPAPTTTVAPTSTSTRASVIRLSGATPADVGRAVAGALDVRNDGDKAKGVPAFTGAVVVNPANRDAAAGVAFAASQRYPVLYVSKDGIPAATADAFNSMAIKTAFVVGGPASVSDAVVAKLPSATRLGGPDVAGTTAAVLNQVKAQALPTNVVYLADQSRPVDAAVAAADVSRVGGILVVNAGADDQAAERTLDQLGLGGQVDRIVVARSVAPASGVPWAVIVVSALLALIGLVLIARAAAGRDAGGARSGPPEPASPASEQTGTRPPA